MRRKSQHGVEINLYKCLFHETKIKKCGELDMHKKTTSEGNRRLQYYVLFNPVIAAPMSHVVIHLPMKDKLKPLNTLDIYSIVQLDLMVSNDFRQNRKLFLFIQKYWIFIWKRLMQTLL
ncbi:hypothetical protein GDO78_011610 [Eleutherodactylus coqui]|uniref:Uncharacterized protein n=1 Tax=Eleutherodactylus coqui TaxID=57060 RepID=A0A8J6K3L7_ELECQ|nr:hypothetical protein GDO78_011610 [Eleutherodactylus coqui]